MIVQLASDSTPIFEAIQRQFNGWAGFEDVKRESLRKKAAFTLRIFPELREAQST